MRVSPQLPIEKTVYLVDASIYIFRAWFSLPDSIRGDEGQAVNAVYGFSRFLTELTERCQAKYIAIAFDESLTQSFRNDVYPQYKMNRELPPDALAQQFKWCRKVAEAAGVYCVSSARYEADDLIATISHQMRQQGFCVTIVSADKDLAQIVRERDVWWDFAGNKQYDYTQIKEKFGVRAEQIQDYLGLCGDAVDNIPGVPSVGPKTAVALLGAFADMEAMYCQIDKVIDLKIRGGKNLQATLLKYRKQAELSKWLATVAYDAPISVEAHLVQRKSAEVKKFRELSRVLAGRGEGLFQRLIDSSRSC